MKMRQWDQGDHRDRVVAELEKVGYQVKRSGG